jgi:hypothetical protein
MMRTVATVRAKAANEIPANNAGGGSTSDFGRTRSRLWPKHLRHDRRPRSRAFHLEGL